MVVLESRRGLAMEKLYYAHAMCMYGTREERRDLGRIRRRFSGSQIVNPADYDGHPGKLAEGVNFCLRLVKQCDLVVFSPLLGKVTAGVGKEVNYALRIGKPVFKIAGGRFSKCKAPVTYLSRLATLGLYDRWRYRRQLRRA
jgi:hypothetical protein